MLYSGRSEKKILLERRGSWLPSDDNGMHALHVNVAE